MWLCYATCLNPPAGRFILSVESRQKVILERSPDIKYGNATTWETGKVGIVGMDNANKSIREAVKDCIDIFINDYLAVNPKK